MRVMIMHDHMGFYGGAETVVAKLASYLTKKGIENTILTLSKPPESVEECKDLEIITPDLPFRRTASHVTSTFNEIIALQKLYRGNVGHFDLVNVHNFPTTWSIFPKKRPCVWMCNEPPDLFRMKTLRNLFLFFDRLMVNNFTDVICVSDEYNNKRAITRYEKKTMVVPYGIEYELFSNGDREKAIHRFDLYDCFILLQVGMISWLKNQFVSIKAVEELRRHIPNIKLVLAGLRDNGPYGKMIEEYIREKGLEDCVVITGHLHKEVLRHLYHACDIAVFPIKAQGGWLSPFEALCASRPIIVSNEMTASDTIAKEGIGMVTDDLAKTVFDVYQNPKPFQVMAERGRRFVAENLTWDKFCQNMLAVFEDLLLKET